MSNQHPNHKKSNPQHGTKNILAGQTKVPDPQEIQTDPKEGVHKDADDIPRKRLFGEVDKADKYAICIAALALGANLLTLWHMRCDSRMQYRAWVAIKEVFPQPICAGKCVECKFDLVNTGNTPAVNAVVHATVVCRPKDFDTKTFNPGWGTVNQLGYISQATFPPNIPVGLVVASPGALPQTSFDAIQKDELRVYFLGEIVYDDVFRKHHVTQFCFTLDPATKTMTEYKEHNSMN